MTRRLYAKAVPLLLLLAACQTRGCLFSCGGAPGSIAAEPASAPRRTLKSPRPRSRPGTPIAVRADAGVRATRGAPSEEDSIAVTSALEGAGFFERYFPTPSEPEPAARPDDAAAPSAAAGEANASDAGAMATPGADVDAAAEPAQNAEASRDAGGEPIDQARAAAVVPPEEQAHRATEAFQAVYGIGRDSTGVGIGPGSTGEGSGSGYTGVGSGSGSTGMGSGRGATGDGSGAGWTGYGSGRGDTTIGSGAGATGFSIGRGSTGYGSGSGSTGFGSGSGSTGIGLTPFGGRAKPRTATASAARE
jgi:hypothetical protein